LGEGPEIGVGRTYSSSKPFYTNFLPGTCITLAAKEEYLHANREKKPATFHSLPVPPQAFVSLQRSPNGLQRGKVQWVKEAE
jgi:hypothetical protein